MALRPSSERRMMYFCSTLAGGNFAQNKVITRFFMATTEKYTTVIELNSEQAKRNLDELRKKVESWKSDLAEAREKKMGRGFIAAIKGGVRGRVHTNTQHLITNTHF